MNSPQSGTTSSMLQWWGLPQNIALGNCKSEFICRCHLYFSLTHTSCIEVTVDWHLNSYSDWGYGIGKKYSKSAFIFPCHLYMSCRTHGVLNPCTYVHSLRPAPQIYLCHWYINILVFATGVPKHYNRNDSLAQVARVWPISRHLVSHTGHDGERSPIQSIHYKSLLTNRRAKAHAQLWQYQGKIPTVVPSRSRTTSSSTCRDKLTTEESIYLHSANQCRVILTYSGPLVIRKQTKENLYPGRTETLLKPALVNFLQITTAILQGMCSTIYNHNCWL